MPKKIILSPSGGTLPSPPKPPAAPALPSHEEIKRSMQALIHVQAKQAVQAGNALRMMKNSVVNDKKREADDEKEGAEAGDEEHEEHGDEKQPPKKKAKPAALNTNKNDDQKEPTKRKAKPAETKTITNGDVKTESSPKTKNEPAAELTRDDIAKLGAKLAAEMIADSINKKKTAAQITDKDSAKLEKNLTKKLIAASRTKKSNKAGGKVANAKKRGRSDSKPYGKPLPTRAAQMALREKRVAIREEKKQAASEKEKRQAASEEQQNQAASGAEQKEATSEKKKKKTASRQDENSDPKNKPNEIIKKTWDERYQDLVEFKKRFGHTEVGDWKEDPQLANWVWNQRKRYTYLSKGVISFPWDNKRLIGLTEGQIIRLNEIGFRWGSLGERRKQESTTIEEIPAKVQESLALIAKEKAQVLAHKQNRLWQKMCNKLIAYKALIGNCEINKRDMNAFEPGLSKWADLQRQLHKKSELPEERVKLLDEIGFPWEEVDKKEKSLISNWETRFEELLDFRRAFGHVNVPAKWRHNVSLAQWVIIQRKKYKALEEGVDGRINSEYLTKDQIKRLKKVDFNFTPDDGNKNNDIEDKADSPNPVTHQKASQKTEKRQVQETDQADRLDDALQPSGSLTPNLPQDALPTASEYEEVKAGSTTPALPQDSPPQASQNTYTGIRVPKMAQNGDCHYAVKASLPYRINKSNNSLWNEMYQRLCAYKEEHGDCEVPPAKDYPRDPTLSLWVRTQRTNYRTSKLSEERISALDEIGFDWVGPTKQFWFKMYDELKAFKAEKGHCCVPDKIVPLGKWVSNQRGRYFGKWGYKPLTDKQLSLLTEIGFVWDARQKDGQGEENWNAFYEKMKAHKREHGHCTGSLQGPDFGLWVKTQRELYKASKLSQEKIDLLEEIGFVWEVTNSKISPYWDEMYPQMKEYMEENGTCDYSKCFADKPELAMWVDKQCHLHKTNRLSKKRLDLLQQLGFNIETFHSTKPCVPSSRGRPKGSTDDTTMEALFENVDSLGGSNETESSDDNNHHAEEIATLKDRNKCLVLESKRQADENKILKDHNQRQAAIIVEQAKQIERLKRAIKVMASRD